MTSPTSVQSLNRSEDGKENTVERRKSFENGHPVVEVDETGIRKGENLYLKYYQQQSEPSGVQVNCLNYLTKMINADSCTAYPTRPLLLID
jgi:pre-mRNA-processing factor 39